MALIYQSENFIVASADRPLIDREDGGHIIVEPIIKIVDRQQLQAREAIEFMRLTMVAGEAMKTVLSANGIAIGRINYQDNGNWSVLKPEGPHFHLHIYGRAMNARYQPYGQACYFPHPDTHPEWYARLKPLSSSDIDGICKKIYLLLSEARYADEHWRLQQ
jgi:diadenosine tetraphosphate (Ap4A) HIT family hydrolase